MLVISVLLYSLEQGLDYLIYSSANRIHILSDRINYFFSGRKGIFLQSYSQSVNAFI